MDFCKTEVEYFCAEGWTGEIRLKSLGKIVVLERAQLGPTFAHRRLRKSELGE